MADASPCDAAHSAHRLRLFSGAGEFLDAVLPSIQSARRRAFVESYILRDDPLGHALFGALTAAARAGAEVRLLYEPSGARFVPRARFSRLRNAGVQVQAFGKLPWLGLLRPGVRDHARVVIADDVAYTGGHAWGLEWLPADRGGGGWRDLNCRVEGPIVRDWQQLYDRRWHADGTGIGVDTGAAYPDVRLISDGPRTRRSIVHAHLEAFERAERRIWLGNAYFFPSQRFTRALYRAVARGVDVKIIVPGRSDLRTVYKAARTQYPAWLRNGLGLYEYRRTMMHAKYAVVDDDWCTLGSYNAMGTAATLTVEANLVVSRRAFVNATAQHFVEDLAASRQVTLAELAQRSLPARWSDLAAWSLLSLANRLAGGDQASPSTASRT